MLSADFLGFCPPKDVGVLPSPQQTRPPPAILISRADPFFEGGGGTGGCFYVAWGEDQDCLQWVDINFIYQLCFFAGGMTTQKYPKHMSSKVL